MRSVTVVLTLFLLLIVSACTAGHQDPITATPSAQAPRPPDFGEIWYSSYGSETTAFLHSSNGKSVTPGETFALTDDGTYVAVASGGALEIMRVSDRVRVAVNPKVESFQWRPGSHELLFLVRDTEKPHMARWYLRREDGAVAMVTDAGFNSLLLAKTSPDGEWVAYDYARVLVVVSLTGGQTYKLPLHEKESAGIATWSGSDHLAVEAGTELVLIRVPSGERHTFADVGAEVTAYPVWSQDGQSVAVRTRAGTSVYRRGNPRVRCEGPWRPVNWSPDGRYLAIRHGDIVPDMEVYVLDTQNESTCKPMLIPGIRGVEAWHPSSTGVLLTTSRTSTEAGELQVWEITSEGAVLRNSLGNGTNARWVDSRRHSMAK